jgi:hypothetical protein
VSLPFPFPPGHPQSVATGCLCPVTDNAHGAGCGYVDAAGNALYIFEDRCPLHGGDQAEPMDPEELCYDAAMLAGITEPNT